MNEITSSSKIIWAYDLLREILESFALNSISDTYKKL